MAKAKEGLDLNPNGKAGINLPDGMVITLRRPKISELRKLSEQIEELRDSIRTRVEDADAKFDPTEDLVAFARDIVNLLGEGGALPEAEDELPSWIATADFSNQLFVYWRTVPLVRG